jgi:hypothetical protein
MSRVRAESDVAFSCAEAWAHFHHPSPVLIDARLNKLGGGEVRLSLYMALDEGLAFFLCRGADGICELQAPTVHCRNWRQSLQLANADQYIFSQSSAEQQRMKQNRITKSMQKQVASCLEPADISAALRRHEMPPGQAAANAPAPAPQLAASAHALQAPGNDAPVRTALGPAVVQGAQAVAQAADAAKAGTSPPNTLARAAGVATATATAVGLPMQARASSQLDQAAVAGALTSTIV